MGIPVTIEFLSSLRSSFQLHSIKKNTDNSEAQGKEIKFYTKYFYKNIEISVKRNFDSEITIKNNKTMNHRCYGRKFLERKFYLIQAHGIKSCFKQQSQKIIINWKIVIMCY